MHNCEVLGFKVGPFFLWLEMSIFNSDWKQRFEIFQNRRLGLELKTKYLPQ